MDRLRVLTLNIWNRQGPWELRRELIQQGLHIEAPDVALLQEVLRLGSETSSLCQAEELARGLPYEVAYGPACDLGTPEEGGARFTLGNAILSRFPIRQVRTYVLPHPHDEQIRETRCLLHALLDTPAGPLPVFTTHLDWQLDLSWVRCKQVRFITDRIEEVRATLQANGEDVLPAVLGGDLNAEQESDEVRYLRGLHPLPDEQGRMRSVYYADCFRDCGSGPATTFCRDNRYAAAEREPDRCLDYLFVGGLDRHLRGEPLWARRCFTQPQGQGDEAVFASDHYGVVAEVQVGKRQRARF